MMSILIRQSFITFRIHLILMRIRILATSPIEPMRPPRKCVTVGNGTNLIYCKDLGEYSDPIDYSDISQFYWRYLTL